MKGQLLSQPKKFAARKRRGYYKVFNTIFIFLMEIILGSVWVTKGRKIDDEYTYINYYFAYFGPLGKFSLFALEYSKKTVVHFSKLILPRQISELSFTHSNPRDDLTFYYISLFRQGLSIFKMASRNLGVSNIKLNPSIFLGALLPLRVEDLSKLTLPHSHPCPFPFLVTLI